MSTFGERFKQLRKEKDLSQDELVKDFNKKYHYDFNRPAISNYETDRRIPEIEALRAFADYFGVTMDYLLGRSDKRIEVVAKDDIKLKISRELLDTLSKEGYELQAEDIPDLIEVAKLVLKMKKK